MVECSFTIKVGVVSSSAAVTQILDIAPVSSNDFLDIQAITECRINTLNTYVTW